MLHEGAANAKTHNLVFPSCFVPARVLVIYGFESSRARFKSRLASTKSYAANRAFSFSRRVVVRNTLQCMLHLLHFALRVFAMCHEKA